MVMANNDIEIYLDVVPLINGGEQWMACRKKVTDFQDKYFPGLGFVFQCL
jgi:hypothetical protein